MMQDARSRIHDAGTRQETGDRRQEIEGKMKQLSLKMHLESQIVNLAFPIFVFIRG
jgi:hypothetical protein